MIKITFDGIEYFNFTSLIGNHNISQNLAFKEVIAEAVATEPFKDFIVLLNKESYVLARVFVNNKLFLEGWVNDSNFGYSDSAQGTKITININDRFIGIKESDLIYAEPKGSLESYLSTILYELGYDDELFKDTYQKKITSAKDFVELGAGVDEKHKLKTHERQDLVDYDAAGVLGEMCSIENVLLISNGYDTLSFEKANANKTPTFHIIRSTTTNITHAEKVGAKTVDIPPRKVIILNTNDKEDSNSSIIAINKNGLPHVQKVNHVSTKQSYKELAQSLDYSFAGIKARTNSFLYKCANLLFDDNGNFFRPNNCVKVLDYKYGIDEVMNILQVGFKIDASQGSEVVFNLTTQRAFDDNASIKQKRGMMSR